MSPIQNIPQFTLPQNFNAGTVLGGASSHGATQLLNTGVAAHNPLGGVVPQQPGMEQFTPPAGGTGSMAVPGLSPVGSPSMAIPGNGITAGPAMEYQPTPNGAMGTTGAGTGFGGGPEVALQTPPPTLSPNPPQSPYITRGGPTQIATTGGDSQAAVGTLPTVGGINYGYDPNAVTDPLVGTDQYQAPKDIFGMTEGSEDMTNFFAHMDQMQGVTPQTLKPGYGDFGTPGTPDPGNPDPGNPNPPPPVDPPTTPPVVIDPGTKPPPPPDPPPIPIDPPPPLEPPDPTTFPNQDVLPQTGLIGSELALGEGLDNAINSLSGGVDRAEQFLGDYYSQGQNEAMAQINSGSDQARNDLNTQILNAMFAGAGAMDEGAAGGKDSLNSLYAAALAGNSDLIRGGTQDASDLLSSQYEDGISGLENANKNLNPWVQGGQGAAQSQAALTGALGADAQKQAYADFLSSPGQDYLKEESEKALLRNSAATGGLGGGRVLQALQENAIGLAAQDFDNSFNRLDSVSGRGEDAAKFQTGITGDIMNARGDMGSQLANLTQTGALTEADMNSALRADLGSSLADIDMTTGMAKGDMLQSGLQNFGAQLADLETSRGENLAGIVGETNLNLGDKLADLAMIEGTQGADYAYNTGTQLAGGRTDAGNAISNNIGDMTNALAALQNQGGLDVANQIGAGATDLANLLTGSGQANAETMQALATLLANIQTGQGSQAAGLPSVSLGSTGGGLAGFGNLLAGIGSFF